MAKERTERYVDVAAFIAALSGPQKTTEQWLKEGNAHHAAKRYEEALVAFERAIELAPHFVYSYLYKGYTLTRLLRYQEALAAYERAIELDPNLRSAYLGKCVALDRMGRTEEAGQAYEKAQQLGFSRHV